jgi:hypothetical protein
MFDLVVIFGCIFGFWFIWYFGFDLERLGLDSDDEAGRDW